MSKTYYILEDSIHCAAYYENWQEIICGLEKLGWKRIENVQTSDIVLVVHCCITVVEIEKVMQILANLSKERILGKPNQGFGRCSERNITKPKFVSIY